MKCKILLLLITSYLVSCKHSDSLEGDISEEKSSSSRGHKVTGTEAETLYDALLKVTGKSSARPHPSKVEIGEGTCSKRFVPMGVSRGYHYSCTIDSISSVGAGEAEDLYQALQDAGVKAPLPGRLAGGPSILSFKSVNCSQSGRPVMSTCEIAQ